MKKLNIICCVNDTIREKWECRVLMTNLKEQGLIDKFTLLLFQPREMFLQHFSEEWEALEKEFPEAKIVYYKDVKNITRIGQIFHYIPIFRLYLLQEYFRDNPHLEREAIFYIDSDILITKPLPFEKWLKDDVNYLSWTGNPERTDNYLWQPYFDSKIENVDEKHLEQYKKLDVLDKVAKICGTSREEITKNNANIGGAQYLLKNINSQFWTDCFNSCCEIKLYLEDINRIFMKGETSQEKENNGYQSFCSDMISILFHLIARGVKIECPKELDFCWSSDRIKRFSETSICHNAGIISNENIRIANERKPDGSRIDLDCKVFYKGAYINKSPFDDMEYLYSLRDDLGNQQFCNNEYIKVIIKCVDKK